jgi:hypothetical protein
MGASERTYLTNEDVQKRMGCKESKAGKVIRQLNKELQDRGYIVMPGKINRQYFEERVR